MSYEAILAVLRVMAPSECHMGRRLMGRAGQPWTRLQSPRPPMWMHMSFYDSRLLERTVLIWRVI